MLTRKENELLCQTGPGTPMGELWRRFWLPALLPEELPEPDCPPIRFQILGENLVAFRDASGKVGFMQENCPHRGASMFFGRNEENGLRCVYHGWKFDTTGACVDMPNEPAESNFKHKIHATTYPSAEWGGLIWLYMGPKDLEPQLPQLEWCLVPPEHRFVGKWIQHCNFAQAYEGEIDTSHVSFLHRWFDVNNDPQGGNRARKAPTGTLGLAQYDGSPVLTVKPTDYGMTYGARRQAADGEYYWRVTQFLFPDYSLIPSPTYAKGGRCWIPRDDESIWVFFYQYDPEQPISQEQRDKYLNGVLGMPRLIPGTFEPVARADNDYLIDREMQKTLNYVGIANGREQDMAVVESMGPIYDRTNEHLGTADTAIITARRLLMKMATDLVEKGVEPYAATHGDVYRVRALDIVDQEPEFGVLIEKHKDEIAAAGPKPLQAATR